ncbi:MAG TPA: glycosyltransferase family 2 protein [Gaiellaceae bacterium]|nr:glycosyltransferase family 2 protein [Gaiellaceae bacterium]
MKVVMTLLVRDEADVVGDHLRYHLERGVDFVVATDHRSCDGTTDILREHERAGHLRLIREHGEALRQSEWVTRMARLAATELGADWVISSDADEFWWPREGSLREVLAAVPPRFGAVRGIWRHFVLRPDSPEPFYERMTVRRRPDPDWTSPYHVQVKVVHRADPQVVVSKGNHDAVGERLVLLREWYPFEILHFPLRSRDQLLRKYRAAATAGRLGEGGRLPRHTSAVEAALREGGEERVYRDFLVDDGALARGLADGRLFEDRRLRDVLAGDARGSERRPTLADDLALAEEIDALHLHDAATRLRARVEALDGRVSALERLASVARARATRSAV